MVAAFADVEADSRRLMCSRCTVKAVAQFLRHFRQIVLIECAVDILARLAGRLVVCADRRRQAAHESLRTRPRHVVGAFHHHAVRTRRAMRPQLLNVDSRAGDAVGAELQ